MIIVEDMLKDIVHDTARYYIGTSIIADIARIEYFTENMRLEIIYLEVLKLKTKKASGNHYL